MSHPWVRRLLAVAVCCSGLALIAPATSSPAAAAGTPAVEDLCATPKPGYFGCFAQRRAVQTASGTEFRAMAAPSGLGPADIQSAYKLPSATAGTGKTVAIVAAYDLPTAEADLNTYRSAYGLPACTTANGCFRKVNQSGGTTMPAGNEGWGGEIALDMDMVSASCPKCKILLVLANNASYSNMGTAVNTAVRLGANVVNNSYGSVESSSDPGRDTSYYKHPGVAMTASTGDDGYQVNYPASSPWVTAVGGTSLTRNTGTTRGWTESAWTGAGSGCSAYGAKPAFQTDSGCARRTTADISAVADPNTGVATYMSYGSTPGWGVYGGTSASAPIVAGAYAMAAAPAATAYPNSFPYATKSAFFDITSGSNGTCTTAYLCKGVAGFDGPTGLGTPNGVAGLGPAGVTPPPPANAFSLSLNPTSGSVVRGSTVKTTVSTATTSGAAQTVTLAASGLPAGVTASFSPTTVTSGGSSTLTLTASSTATVATSNITVTGTAASGAKTAPYAMTVTAPATTCAAGQKITNPGFESGTATWGGSSGLIGAFAPDQPAHSGQHTAWLLGYGSTHTESLTHAVTIPAGCTSYKLSFWLHIDTAEVTTTAQYDKLTVSLGTTTLATYSNLNKASGYIQRTIDVKAFAGQTVTLTFKGTEDGAKQTSFVIDDTALTVS